MSAAGTGAARKVTGGAALEMTGRAAPDVTGVAYDRIRSGGRGMPTALSRDRDLLRWTGLASRSRFRTLRVARSTADSISSELAGAVMGAGRRWRGRTRAGSLVGVICELRESRFAATSNAVSSAMASMAMALMFCFLAIHRHARVGRGPFA
ncbi:hypothetical protein Tsubulata_001492 [Turnera subulata]|uniref:Uncharacterized protein n=1 Tax=Turnera subulata TaxID=218843 RepID=A0A9Q0F478_9ROSI|nr:hypothetical protein Tsubulata_001492 [Turnera subulata]